MPTGFKSLGLKVYIAELSPKPSTFNLQPSTFNLQLITYICPIPGSSLSDIKNVEIYADIVEQQHQVASIEHFNNWHQ